MDRSKRNDIQAKRALIEAEHSQLSVRRQREFVGLNRATFYYLPAPESAFNSHLMRLIDIIYIPILRGFLYLVAVMDWYSRYILA
jgi:hypothetical protein